MLVSKREVFKKLLSDDENFETGSSQKRRLLSEEHLLPPTLSEDTKGDEPNSSDELSVNNKDETKNDEINQNSKEAAGHTSSVKVLGSNIGRLNDSSMIGTGSDIQSLISALADVDEQNVEETHTRRTYLIENELLAELERISKGKKKGYKTMIINTGLRIVLDLIKNKQNNNLGF